MKKIVMFLLAAILMTSNVVAMPKGEKKEKKEKTDKKEKKDNSAEKAAAKAEKDAEKAAKKAEKEAKKAAKEDKKADKEPKAEKKEKKEKADKKTDDAAKTKASTPKDEESTFSKLKNKIGNKKEATATKSTPAVKNMPNNSNPSDKSIGKDDKGRTIFEGPRGGQYYINGNGNKTYIKRDN